MGIPAIQPSGTTRSQAITDMIASVALEQTALSHILNAEGEKLQKALASCAELLITQNHALKEFHFIYEGETAYHGLGEQGHAFVVFYLQDSTSTEKVMAYCMDINTFIVAGEHYDEVVLTGNIDLSELDAKRIRHILLTSFPYIDMAALRPLCGIASLTEAEAVTATQLAIWKLTNNFEMTHSNSNVMTLYHWYLALTPMEITLDPAQIELTAQPVYSETKCGVAFRFHASGVNSDGTQVPLSYTFSKNIVSEYGAIVSETTSGGETIVTVTNLPQGAQFSILIAGVQTLPYEAYRYRNAQDLVGLLRQTNTMHAQCDYLCTGNCGFDVLKINKSVLDTVNSIALLELILQGKLSLFGDCLCGTE